MLYMPGVDTFPATSTKGTQVHNVIDRLSYIFSRLYAKHVSHTTMEISSPHAQRRER